MPNESIEMKLDAASEAATKTTKAKAKGANIIVVCSKLIHGVELTLGDKVYLIKGQNDDPTIEYKGYTGKCGMTAMDKTIWEGLKQKYMYYAPIKKGFIFAVGDMRSAEDANKDMKDLKTDQDQIPMTPGKVFIV